MSYEISYQPEKKYLYPVKKSKNKFVYICVLLCLCFCVALSVRELSSYWFTFLDSVAENIQNGSEFGKTFAQCCAEIGKYATSG